MTSSLNRTGFVLVDMAAFGSHHAFIRTENRSDDRRIGLRTTYQEVHRNSRTTAGLPDFLTRFRTIMISSIPRSFLHIRLHQAFQD